MNNIFFFFSVKVMAYGLGDDTMLELSVHFRNQCSCKLNKNHSCEIALKKNSFSWLKSS